MTNHLHDAAFFFLLIGISIRSRRKAPWILVHWTFALVAKSLISFTFHPSSVREYHARLLILVCRQRSTNAPCESSSFRIILESQKGQLLSNNKTTTNSPV